MKSTQLGAFEELILLAVCVKGDDAYGVSVLNEIKVQAGRIVTLGAVHATMYRLQEKGFLDSEMGGATERRGGRRKRLFTVTGAGFEMVRSSRDVRESMWKLIPRLEGSAS